VLRELVELGEVYLQDEASQLVAHLVDAGLRPSVPERLHDLVEREMFYPAIEPQAHDAIASALRAHDDIQQCVQLLRRLPVADAEHDSTMMRLMDLLEYHFKEEEEVLFPLVESRMGGRLRALGADIIKRREKVAGAVRDLEAPAT